MRDIPKHYCQKDHRREADEITAMEDLPKSQGGRWRHGCVECAFEAGLRLGAQREREALLALLQKRRKL